MAASSQIIKRSIGYNGGMANKQAFSSSSKSGYFWLLPLAIAAGLTWWLGVAIWPLVVIWIFLAYYSISLIRGNRLSLLSLAVLYAIMALLCSGGSALGIALWGLNPGESAVSLLWSALPLDLPLVFAFLAYFYYKRQLLALSKKESVATFKQRLLMKSFWVTIGVVVILNLWVALAILGFTLVSLFTLFAVATGLVGVKRGSWAAILVSLIFLGVSIGFVVDSVIGDPQAALRVDVINAQCTLVIVLLAYVIGNFLILRSSRK